MIGAVLADWVLLWYSVIPDSAARMQCLSILLHTVRPRGQSDLETLMTRQLALSFSQDRVGEPPSQPAHPQQQATIRYEVCLKMVHTNYGNFALGPFCAMSHRDRLSTDGLSRPSLAGKQIVCLTHTHEE